MRCGERVGVEDWRVPLLGGALEDNRRGADAGDCLLIVVGFAGAVTGTLHDPGAAPPAISKSTLFCPAGATGGQTTRGVSTELAEQIPGVLTDGIEESRGVPTDVAELCRWICEVPLPGVAPPRNVGGTLARVRFCGIPEELEDNPRRPVAGDCLLIVEGFAGALTGTRHDPGAAPPVVSGTTLFCPAGATLGVPTDVAELCPGRGAVTGSPR